MAQANTYHVAPHGDQWEVKHADAQHATSLHDTQKEAIAVAHEHLHNQGGGELVIHGTDGHIREKTTVAPGNDPRSSKG